METPLEYYGKLSVFWSAVGVILGMDVDRTGFLFNKGPIANALIPAEGEN